MKTVLRSSELSCPSCIAKIEKSLKSLDGVTDAKVHFTTGRIESSTIRIGSAQTCWSKPSVA